jgi:hypothetical protein
MKTLAEVTQSHGFEVYDWLDESADVPVVDGLQAQGDVFVVPSRRPVAGRGGSRMVVAAEGVAVVEAAGGGHEHRLFAGTPGTAWWTPAVDEGQDIGVLECTEPAYLLHPEHGAAGIGPGSYVLRRQREQADVERLVAD